jgi:hypothetical protein
VLCAGAIGLGLTGCGEDNPTNLESPASTDEGALRSMMDGQAGYFDGGQGVSDGQVEVGTPGPRGATGAPIESFFFVREILRREIRRIIVIEESGDRPVAHVSTSADLHGIFHLYYDDPENIYLASVLHKRLEAHAEHRATFVRWLRPDRDPHRGWRLTEVSGTEVVSVPTTKDIVSVEIISPSVHRMITDPLALVPLRELPTFQPGESVTLRVKTTDATDFVFLHTGLLKDEFQPIGEGIYEGTWTVGERRGYRRVAVDVIDHETLFDDEAPYDSAAWVFQYRVAGDDRESFEQE